MIIAMKNKVLIFLVMIIGSFTISYLIPAWWIYIPVSFFGGVMLPRTKANAFLIGFCAIFCLWFVSSFVMDQQNDQILSSRIIQLFHLPNSFLLIVLTSIIGGLIGGLASWSGNLFKLLYVK